MKKIVLFVFSFLCLTNAGCHYPTVAEQWENDPRMKEAAEKAKQEQSQWEKERIEREDGFAKFQAQMDKLREAEKKRQEIDNRKISRKAIKAIDLYIAFLEKHENPTDDEVYISPECLTWWGQVKKGMSEERLLAEINYYRELHSFIESGVDENCFLAHMEYLRLTLGYLDSSKVTVQGYFRKDGTYVSPHFRSRPK